ncbi:DNA-binding transcriptional regulator, LysR family [Paraburkholderia steynii]|uniref:DNA-binding transcriptional regulator, LysR family n=1 Tax=Paraburkholderia steynii TaxID=1245441 RepID=A0A7Z7FFH7_9BURK|nr:LysR family transcriptional regulator [Paraburkholderia steynii]SDH33727.1 DNA-binding transcriptional regulator, LysR family [Paraburkholderia steynii]
MIDGDLTYFLTIASAGTLARAAEQLGISQPAVTKAIQRLERKVGVTLVERTARGSVLTEAGKIFHTRVLGASMQLDSALQEVRDIGGGHAGLLRIGATPATTSFALRSLFPTLLVERPAARVNVTTAFSDTLLDAIDKREVELAVCPLPDTLDASMAKELLYDDHYSLMVSTTNPLADRESITLHDLVECSWAASSRQEFARVQLEQAFAKQGYPRMRIVAEANSLAALILIVSTTRLVSLINARSFDLGPLPFNIAVRPIQFDGLRRQVGLIRRAGYLSPIAQRAQEILRNAAREL